MSKHIYLIKARKSAKNDIFGMFETGEHLFFFASTLKDLRATLRCITSKGYRIPQAPTLSKYMKAHNGHFIVLNLFRTTMYEIKNIQEKLEIKKAFDYENSFGFKHNLKVVDSSIAAKYFLTTVIAKRT